MPDRWDFYEVTFSVDGDENEALSLFEQFEKLPGVKGAVFSAGNHGPHPFSRADVARAVRVLDEWNWRSGSLTIGAEMLVNAVLTAATGGQSPEPESPEERHHRQLHDGELNQMPPEHK